ncbi:SUR7 family protein pun1-like protein 2 [Botrytis cinerea]
MFGFFITGIVMCFCNIFLSFFTIYSRWISGFYAIWTFITALLTTTAAIIATVMFIIFRNVVTSQAGLNIGASIGTQMFAFMWEGCEEWEEDGESEGLFEWSDADGDGGEEGWKEEDDSGIWKEEDGGGGGLV